MTIRSIEDYSHYLGIAVDDLEHALYKGTACGAWITWDEKSISIGSIVEGSDAEFSKTFVFPTDTESIDKWLDSLEDLCDEAWREANEWEEEEDI